MDNATPFFEGFNRYLFGRKRRSAKEQLEAQLQEMRQASLCQLAKLFAPWLPTQLLEPTDSGANSRRHTYTLAVTFWAFLCQVLAPATPCRKIVRKVQAWCATHGLKLPSSDNGAYCKARAKLPLERLSTIQQHVGNDLHRRANSDQHWCGRSVKVVDGTCVSMPDTPENQARFPQSSGQKPGCGFPCAKLVACFSLASAALLRYAVGSLNENESTLWRRIWDDLDAGDVVLTDRGFNSYSAMAALYDRGVDSVMRLHQARKCDFTEGKKLGDNDQLVTWKKPKWCPKAWSREHWEQLPETLTVRLVKVQVMVPGFRTEIFIMATTLTDHHRYSCEALAELYMRRWAVELYFRDIKTTMGMDVLRCKKPEMVEREILMHAIAYNLIRGLMQHAAALYQVDLTRISFKGTVDTLREWHEVLTTAQKSESKRAKLTQLLMKLIAEDILPDRPNRVEPRAVKRRPKQYHLLTKPRKEMIITPRKNRRRKSS